MKRKGMSLAYFTFMTVFVVVAAAGNFTLFHMYVGSLEQEVSSASQSQSADFGRREEVMNAECITRERGIFYRSQIEDNPDALSCISYLDDEFDVAFAWRESSGGGFDALYGYRINPQGAGEPSEVSQPVIDLDIGQKIDQLTTSQDYPVVVYDAGADEYYQGILQITQ